MTLLNLPAEALFFNVLGLLVCAGIVIASICRLDITTPQAWRLSLEQLMLIAFALWAAGTFVDLMRGHLIGFHGAAGGLGIGLYLFLSFKQWSLQQALQREAAEREALRNRQALRWSEQEDGHAAARHH